MMETARTEVSAVRISGLFRHFQRSNGDLVKAIDNVSLDVNPGEFLVLLGPSGCGKTTLLRCIAGLEHATAGTIEIDGSCVFDAPRGLCIPTERRGISMVFQSYALWPHMTIERNVAYPLQSQSPRISRTDVAHRVKTVLEQVGLGGIAEQYPNQISGGQQQRAALARALVAGNKLILFDEPLSNVDAKVRDQLREELVAMQHKLGFAAVYVTHDQTEAMQLADRVAVLNEGKISQIASPRDVYRQPLSRYVAGFVGTTNELAGRVVSISGNEVVLATAVGNVRGCAGHSSIIQGDEVVGLWRPEDTFVSSCPGLDCPSWEGTIVKSSFLGSFVEQEIQIGALRIRRVCESRAAAKPGEKIRVGVLPQHVWILPINDA